MTNFHPLQFLSAPALDRRKHKLCDIGNCYQELQNIYRDSSHSLDQFRRLYLHKMNIKIDNKYYRNHRVEVFA